MTGRQIVIKSQAKVNLTFDILGCLPDGYHEVSTLMQAIDLGDVLTFNIEKSNQFKVDIVLKGDDQSKQFPLDDNNLICIAAKAFWQTRQLDAVAIRVEVEKEIPIAAGLAGGSSNAAATLIALNEYFANLLNPSEMQELARSLGADVPFCLAGGIAVGHGRGDIIKPVQSELEFFFCVVKPKHIALSTPWVYKQYDQYVDEKGMSAIKRPSLENAVGALSFGDLEAAIDSFGNVFEPVVYAHYPELAELKQLLSVYKCPYVQLTGSGPTIFAITSDFEMAHFVRRKLVASAYADKLDIFIASSVKNGLKVSA